MAESQKIYAGFLPGGEEYTSLLEWAEQRAKGHIDDELLARYCNAVQNMLVPISINPPALTQAMRIENRKRAIEEIEQRLKEIVQDDPEEETLISNISMLESEISSIESGEDTETEYLVVEDLLERISNTKTLKEIPYIYKMFEKAERSDLSDQLVLAIYEGKSHTEVRKVAESLRNMLEESDDDDDDDGDKFIGRPVITMKMTKRGMELHGIVPDWMSDKIVGILGSEVDFRFEQSVPDDAGESEE
jgi:hypothetical protein